MTDTPGPGDSDVGRLGITEVGSGRPAWVGPRPMPLTTLVGREQEALFHGRFTAHRDPAPGTENSLPR